MIKTPIIIIIVILYFIYSIGAQPALPTTPKKNCPSFKANNGNVFQDVNPVSWWVILIKGGPGKKMIMYCDSNDLCHDNLEVEQTYLTSIKKNLVDASKDFKKTRTFIYASNGKADNVYAHQRSFLFLDDDAITATPKGGFVVSHSIPDLHKNVLSAFSQHMICYTLGDNNDVNSFKDLLKFSVPKEYGGKDEWLWGANGVSFPQTCNSKLYEDLSKKEPNFVTFIEGLQATDVETKLKDHCYKKVTFDSGFDIYSFANRVHTKLISRGSSGGTDFYYRSDKYRLEQYTNYIAKPPSTASKLKTIVPMHYYALDTFTIVSVLEGMGFYTISHKSGETIGSYHISDDRFIVNFIWPKFLNIHDKIGWNVDHGRVCFGDSNRQKTQLSHLGTMICVTSKKLADLIVERKPSLVANNFQCQTQNGKEDTYANKKWVYPCQAEMDSHLAKASPGGEIYREESSERSFYFYKGTAGKDDVIAAKMGVNLMDQDGEEFAEAMVLMADNGGEGDGGEKEKDEEAEKAIQQRGYMYTYEFLSYYRNALRLKDLMDDEKKEFTVLKYMGLQCTNCMPVKEGSPIAEKGKEIVHIKVYASNLKNQKVSSIIFNNDKGYVEVKLYCNSRFVVPNKLHSCRGKTNSFIGYMALLGETEPFFSTVETMVTAKIKESSDGIDDWQDYDLEAPNQDEKLDPPADPPAASSADTPTPAGQGHINNRSNKGRNIQKE